MEKLDIPEDLPFEVYTSSPRNKPKKRIEVPGWVLGALGFIKKHNGFGIVKDFITNKFFKKNKSDHSDQNDEKLISSILKEIEKLQKDNK